MKLLKKIFEMKAVRYFLSSCAAFAVDYVIFLALDRVLGGISFLSMELAAVAAFAVSSQVNFWLNRRWVFRSQGSVPAEMAGYYSLAGAAFLIKTFILLEIFVRLLKIPKPLAKPLSEAAMFVFNYTIQKKIVFRKGRK